MKVSSLFYVLGAIFSIQLGAALAKGLFEFLEAEQVAALRIFFAALLLLLIFRPWRERIDKKQISFILLYGFCLGMMNLLFYLALERIPLGIAVALEFVGPLGVAILLSKKWIDFLWGILASVGIFLLLPIHSFSSRLDSMGVLLALAAGIFWGFYIYFGARTSAISKGGTAASLGMVVAAVIVIPFGLSSGAQGLNAHLLGMVFLIAILSSALPYTLEMFALKKIPAKTFGIFMSLEPAVATMFGKIHLKEDLSIVQQVAIICVIFASIGSSLSGRPKKVPAATGV